MTGSRCTQGGAESEGPVSLGLDIGAVNAKVAVVGGTGKLILLATERVGRGPAEAAAALLERVRATVPPERIVAGGVCGSGRQLYDRRPGWQAFSSPYAAIAGVLNRHPDARTIVQIGGQSAFVVGLEGGLDRPWRVARSPLCAAGTGRFLEQQAYRLGIPIEEFGARALEWTQAPPRIAARCSVFAKSDLIHLQQKGWPIAAMLAGLCDSVARMIRAQWREALVSPVFFIGGVAANAGVVRALSAAAGEPVIVPSEPAGLEAIGAALLAARAAGDGRVPPDLEPRAERDSSLFLIPRRLVPTPSCASWQPARLTPGRLVDVYLGVDVGSTSTKAAVIDAEGTVLAKSYLMTAGQALEAVKRVMAELAPQVEGKVRVRAVGVTGSGRYLVGHFIGADLIKNEITAQTRAALHIDPTVDTIFELGGQDCKYVYLGNGTALDYRMNKACAAGTGSFLDELAEQLGIPTRTGEFARQAFAAECQLDLGERCAAFMSQAVTSAQHANVSPEVIVSSLATSLAKNYCSKVVGTGRVGERIFLTGAVFYNEAAVAAFRAELPGKTFVVPEHKEVTGAIGVALLAKEAMREGVESSFKGFSQVARAEYKLTNLNCHHCENSCAISAMRTESGATVYYGSRCDRYDAFGAEGARAGQLETPFTERQRLLFNLPEVPAGRPLVGVPRALLTYDLAPLLSAFLKELGAGLCYSPPTNKALIERSVERAYTDSCFPIKLLHGHVAHLLDKGVDYVLVPNAIRLGRKSGEEDQHYACPLVQAAPYIVRSVFDLGDRLLDPVIDLSRGDEALIAEFGRIARRLGFGEARGRQAGRLALERQREFEASLRAAGRRILDGLAADPQAIGVVFLSRSYNAQDHGANLGMAQALARLGVVPIPLDYLPLDKVDLSDVTDRPYWHYERKLLAASKLIASHPQLFGLFLSNFGCGPNSILENVIEDIMDGKPLGHIEIDEHAAEAGYITRLEALVDTIRSYHKAGLGSPLDPARYARRVASSVRPGQTLLIVHMADHAEVIAAAMQAFGVDARVLPESDERSMALSRDVTSGKECLPFRDTIGVFLRMAEDGELPPGARALMPGSFGPCRLGKYAGEQQKILDERGIDLAIFTTVSNNAYGDLGLSQAFELLAWQGAVAVDHLQKLLWMVRPYECRAGEANRAYAHYLAQLVAATRERRSIDRLMREAVATFLEMRDPAVPRRPLVGINGEYYLRANRYCNQDVVALCEANGLEVEVAPLNEWLLYVALRNVEDGLANRDLRRVIKGSLRKWVMEHYYGRVASWFAEAIAELGPSPRHLLAASGRYLPSRNGSEAVLSLGTGALQLADPRFAAVISVMPHGCMPGGIVAALAEQVSREHGYKPWVSLTYDGFPDTVNGERIADLAEQVRHQLPPFARASGLAGRHALVQANA